MFTDCAVCPATEAVIQPVPCVSMNSAVQGLLHVLLNHHRRRDTISVRHEMPFIKMQLRKVKVLLTRGYKEYLILFSIRNAKPGGGGGGVRLRIFSFFKGLSSPNPFRNAERDFPLNRGTSHLPFRRQ